MLQAANKKIKHIYLDSHVLLTSTTLFRSRDTYLVRELFAFLFPSWKRFHGVEEWRGVRVVASAISICWAFHGQMNVLLLTPVLSVRDPDNLACLYKVPWRIKVCKFISQITACFLVSVVYSWISYFCIRTSVWVSVPKIFS